ncbi:MAG: UDP-N-acetyl-D-glucosamine 6-dehydrogenase (EC 1.1.1.136), partial [Olavius algarvensis Gamma 1 endosymbiont]
GDRHPGSTRGGGRQVEFPALQAGPGGRTLHQCGSLLSDLQGPGRRLSPGDHPRRSAHQRQHGRLHHRPCRQTHDPAQPDGAGQPGAGARPDLQGELPGSAYTRVVDIVRELADYGISVDVHDPWVDPHEAEDEYGIAPIRDPQPGSYDAVIL